MKPLCIDLYCGLGGWAIGFLSEDYRVIGFDNGDCGRKLLKAYPGQLVIQDVLTLHGSQFRDVTVIVCSPPCQAYSYRAMPWKRAKALPPPSNELFDACFRIQREASEAAGRHIPMVVENVKGAQPWVGRAKWHYGSYYLWGDVPALMPITFLTKMGGYNLNPGPKKWGSHTIGGYENAQKNDGGSWFAVAHNTDSGHSRNPVNDEIKINGPRRDRGLKPGEFGWHKTMMANGTSKLDKRKAASAMIAKIPFPLARHIARVFKEQGS